MIPRTLIMFAWDSAKRHHQLVLVYVAFTFITVYLHNHLYLQIFGLRDSLEAWQLYVAMMLNGLLVVVAGAIVTAVLFARLGKAIDRPLWKCADDIEALKRFFLPWFIIYLIQFMLVRLIGSAAKNDNEDLAMMWQLMMLIVIVLSVPMGAMIMYWGRLDWHNMHEALAPMINQFHLAIVPLFLGFCNFGVYVLGSFEVTLHPTPTVNAIVVIPSSFLDCLTFIAMWRVCMFQRDNPERTDDDYFDF